MRGVSMLSPVDAQQAIADLTEISSQIQAAVVFDDKGKVAGSTFADVSRVRPPPHPAQSARRPLLRRRRDGVAVERLPRRGPAAAARTRDPPQQPLNSDELPAALRQHAFLEGDFLLRSGKRSKYYLDK